MAWNNAYRRTINATLIGFTVLVLAAGVALAYEFYDDGQGNGCISCHGDFRDSPYTSLKPGEGSWGDDLHDVHRNDMLSGDCDTCHGGLGGSRSPVSTYTSNGGFGYDAIGCVGCHGRDEGSGVVSGVGLRQHHWIAGVTTCGAVDCHADADPANATPVGENVLPPYYGNDGVHTTPTDPCNLPNDYNEGSYAATTLGLDNDGDGVYDENDTDCGAVSAPPGETSGATLNPLLVTAHNTGVSMTLGYETACLTTDNTIYWGALSDLGTATPYSGQECAIGTSGTYLWTYPANSIFFLVVGNDGVNEGSYGLDSNAAERPEDTILTDCPVPQQLTDRCD